MTATEFNRHTTPNGGWIFRQPQTGWTAPTPVASTFSQTVQLIINHRKQNPAITAKHKLATNVEAVSVELEKYTRKRLGLPEVSQAPFQDSRRPFAVQGVGAAVQDKMAGLLRASAGTAVVIDWLGSGGNPVDQGLAEKRAAVCVACPMNQPGDWYVTAPAELLKKTVETWKSVTGRTDFKFETSQGDKLKSCQVCKCLMSLKVFVGLGHILQKTKSDVLAELPQNCWIVRRDEI